MGRRKRGWNGGEGRGTTIKTKEVTKDKIDVGTTEKPNGVLMKARCLQEPWLRPCPLRLHLCPHLVFYFKLILLLFSVLFIFFLELRRSGTYLDRICRGRWGAHWPHTHRRRTWPSLRGCSCGPDALEARRSSLAWSHSTIVYLLIKYINQLSERG